MKKLAFFIIFLFSWSVSAKLKVLTTTPDLAWLIQSLGGERVDVDSLLEGSEDPHLVDAMPHWIAKVSKADLFCEVGMELEAAWAPKIRKRSGNAKIQSGGIGHCEVGKFVQALEVPKTKVDRSMGDVHAGGNPHYQLGPSWMKQAAEGVFGVLVSLDQDGLNVYSRNLEKTLAEIESVHKAGKEKLKPSLSLKLLSYHKEFSYFFKDFGLTSLGELEEVPGVPPSAGRMARVAIRGKQQKIDLLLASFHAPKRQLEKFKELSEIPFRQVHVSIQKGNGPKNYRELILGLAKSIAERSR